jgi:hypothetical protein
MSGPCPPLKKTVLPSTVFTEPLTSPICLHLESISLRHSQFMNALIIVCSPVLLSGLFLHHQGLLTDLRYSNWMA